jgi:hypothetical protein
VEKPKNLYHQFKGKQYFKINIYKIENNYHICLPNLRNFFSVLAAEKSGCVKYVDFFCGRLDLGFILV